MLSSLSFFLSHTLCSVLSDCCEGKTGPRAYSGKGQVVVAKIISKTLNQRNTRSSQQAKSKEKETLKLVNKQRVKEGQKPISSMSRSTMYNLWKQAGLAFGEGGSDHESRTRVAESIRACYPHMVLCEYINSSLHTHDQKRVSRYLIWNF